MANFSLQPTGRKCALARRHSFHVERPLSISLTGGFGSRKGLIGFVKLYVGLSGCYADNITGSNQPFADTAGWSQCAFRTSPE